jgi:hypothetical protein
MLFREGSFRQYVEDHLAEGAVLPVRIVHILRIDNETVCPLRWPKNF